MNTFADQARDKALDIEKLLLKLRKDITDTRPRVVDREAAMLLTRLQSELMLIGVDCAQLKCALSTARTVGEFRERAFDPQLAADAKQRAGHDLTLFED